MQLHLEICCYNLSSCFIAQQNGADRIEFCDNPSEGGTTPSYGSIVMARENLQIPFFPIIRPRGGDFLYNDDEYAAMQRDLKICKDIGCEGVVIGMLNSDGSIDKRRAGKLVQIAYPMSVTFHRAFDRASNPFNALEDIISIGCERILTSGGKPNAMEGVDLISQLVRQADERIIIMPGSGVRSGNISALVQQTGAKEFHSSAQTIVNTSMHFLNDNMNESLSHVDCDAAEVQKIKTVLKSLSLQI